jgi:hypothetical protein
MVNLIGWVKNNRLAAALLVIVAYFALKQLGGGISRQVSYDMMAESGRSSGIANPQMLGQAAPGISLPDYKSLLPIPPVEPDAPPTAGQDRMVIRDTNLSMLVKDVGEVIGRIEAAAGSLGGYMVNSYVARPEGASNGSIVIRVPADQRAEVLNQIRAMGVKVISESVSGRDVTDQYQDLDARIATLETTKAKFESIMETADEVQDILQVQREIINLQTQIDSYKGQQLYLSQSASLTLISVSLSTDELALPYAPDNAWRPEVIFKRAVRALVGDLRGIGESLIWIAVYTPLWLPVLIGILWYRRRQTRKSLTA